MTQSVSREASGASTAPLEKVSISTGTPGVERFAFIHALRGLAALLVVWSHLSGFWLFSTGKVSAIQNVWQQWVVEPFHVFQNGGHLGVVLFFLISGYIITHTSLREDRVSFAIKRVLRIFPALILASMVSFALLKFAQSNGTTLFGVNDGSIWHWLASGVLFDGFLPGGRALDVTWTLIVEIAFYAITFALLGVSRVRPLLSVWIMMGVWVVCSVLSLEVGFLKGSANGVVLIYLGFLILGRIIYFWQRKLVSAGDAILSGSLTALLFLIFIETSEPGFLLAPGGWKGAEPIVSYAFAMIIFVAMMRLAPKKLVWPFGMLGDVSYSLYLLHLPVGITVLNLLARFGVPETLNTLIAIVVSIAVSWVAYRVVELPTQRLARRLVASRPRLGMVAQ